MKNNQQALAFLLLLGAELMEVVEILEVEATLLVIEVAHSLIAVTLLLVKVVVELELRFVFSVQRY